jgi:hypothetical protein
MKKVNIPVRIKSGFAAGLEGVAIEEYRGGDSYVVALTYPEGFVADGVGDLSGEDDELYYDAHELEMI